MSGSMQGAGGVGGLLAIHDHIENKTFASAYDGNGNVIALIDAATGTTDATYEYDPFGNLLLQEGAYALINPFRFSTKYTDNESGLLYYGYRYYNPEIGRWLSRDPIEEQGGVNMYAFAQNDGVNRWDYLGMMSLLGDLPHPDAQEGFSLIRGENFAGPGWGGPARTRPVGVFGFASKLHDFNYHINRLKFSLYSVPKDIKEGSRMAKADFIFDKMNEMLRPSTWLGEFWWWSSKQVFLADSKYFCGNDGFLNVLNHPGMDKPREYLMIPYTELPEPRPVTKEVVYVRQRNALVQKTTLVPDYLQEQAYDYSPGWRGWAWSRYRRLSALSSIDHKTDSTFAW